MILYLVRHGVAEGCEGRCIGRTDAPLSEAGTASLARLASAWPHPPGRLIASGLARAQSSAAVLADAWHLPVETDARLGEMDFGAWDGRTWAELEAEDGARLAEWMAAWVTVPAPGGESFTDVAGRVRAWAAELPREGDAAVVARGEHPRAAVHAAGPAAGRGVPAAHRPWARERAEDRPARVRAPLPERGPCPG
jgi:broad specificity phosphatase PhoE